VRILAIEEFGVGPLGSVHLADLGAEVIKIEDPRTGGDVGRLSVTKCTRAKGAGTTRCQR
jgi:crotonobetainyl-CoA:carnitine CoA-transferase CaiB-like acyl-CoA transferase